MSLEDALKSDALETFARALDHVLAAPEHASVSQHNSSSKVLLAVDASLDVIFQVLAIGAGGKAFYDQLGIARFVKIDADAMDAREVQERIAGSSSSNHPEPPVMFVVPPRPTVAKLIADSVRSLEGTRCCSVLWLPAATSECTLEMERQGVADFVAQHDLSLGLVPIDRGVVSLCRDAVFRELYVRGDYRALTDVVRSLVTIEQHTGARITEVVSHGPFAERVQRMLTLAHTLTPAPARQPLLHAAQRRSPTSTKSSSNSSKNDTALLCPIRQLVLIDRMEDPLTMLLTPMTYDGLLDALLDVNHSIVRYATGHAQQQSRPPASSTSNQSANAPPSCAVQTTTTTTATAIVLLNDDDALYRGLRDVNFNVLTSGVLAEMTLALAAQTRLTGQNAAASLSTQSMPATSAFHDSNTHSHSNSHVDKAATATNVASLIQHVSSLEKKKQALAHHVHLAHAIRVRSTECELRAWIETEMAVVSANKVEAKDAEQLLEEAVLRDPPLALHDVVKMLCLCSLVRGGLKPETLEWYRRQLCQTFGYASVLPLLVQLEKLELLAPASAFKQQRKFDFIAAKKKFALMCGALETSSDGSDKSNSTKPLDIHFMFPYTGIAPLSVRRVQTALGMPLKGLATTLSDKLRPTNDSNSNSNNNNKAATASTTTRDANWTFPVGVTANQPYEPLHKSSNPASSDAQLLLLPPRATVLVYYIGGVTVAELAAYRFLNARQTQFTFVVAATAVCNGSRLLRTIE